MSFTEQEAACRRPDMDKGLVSEFRVVFCSPIGRAGSQQAANLMGAVGSSWEDSLCGSVFCPHSSPRGPGADLVVQVPREKGEFAQGHCC